MLIWHEGMNNFEFPTAVWGLSLRGVEAAPRAQEGMNDLEFAVAILQDLFRFFSLNNSYNQAILLRESRDIVDISLMFKSPNICC